MQHIMIIEDETNIREELMLLLKVSLTGYPHQNRKGICSRLYGKPARI